MRNGNESAARRGPIESIAPSVRSNAKAAVERAAERNFRAYAFPRI